jgi:hypothetical protein
MALAVAPTSDIATSDLRATSRPHGPSHRTRRTVTLGIAAGTAAVLLTAATGVAQGAPAAHHSVASTPKLSITISKKHFKVAGPKTFQAGRVAISLTAKGA